MATFTKLLPVHGGGWGIEGQSWEMIEGALVNVQRRDGTVRILRVGQILWQGEGRAVARIVEDQPPPTPTPTPTPTQHAPQVAYGNGHGHTNGNGHAHNAPAAPQVPAQSAPVPPKAPTNPALAAPVPAPTQQTGTERVAICPDRLKPLAAKLGKVVMLQYDIPETAEFDNPSARLRRIGIRLTLSVWAIQETRIPWPLLDAMTRAGVTWHVVEFAESQSEKLLQIAVDTLEKEFKAGQLSLNASIDSATQAMVDSTSTSTHKAETEYQKRCRAAFKRAEKLVEDLQEAAKAFGVYDDVQTFKGRINQRMQSLNGIVQQRASAYCRMKELAQGTTMESAASDGDIPAQVLADFLTDEGHDVSAESSLFTM